MDAYEGRLTAAIEFARKAGDLTLQWFGDRGLTVEAKSDQSPVTIADRQAEQCLRELISAKFPDDSIVGEEFPDKPGTSSFRWILDPIDGTKSFICGVPLYGTMVAVERRLNHGGSEPVIGVLHFPGLQEGIYAGRGQGAWAYRPNQAQPQLAQVAAVSSLAECVVLTSDHQTFAKRGAESCWDALTSVAKYSRTWGDAYGYYLVASGRAHVMVDPILNIWDAAAVMPIILEAGGLFTDWHGRPRIDSGDAVASCTSVHSAILELLEPANLEPKP